VEKGKAEPFETDSLTKELLDTNKCYILDCGLEVFVWMGRNTSLDERKSASGSTDVISLLLPVIVEHLLGVLMIIGFLLAKNRN